MRRSAMLILGYVVAIFAHPTVSLADEDQEGPPLLTVSANRFGPTFELITLDTHGGRATLLLPFRVAAENPSWSPDCRKIAYRSHKSGEDQLSWKPRIGE